MKPTILELQDVKTRIRMAEPPEEDPTDTADTTIMETQPWDDETEECVPTSQKTDDAGKKTDRPGTPIVETTTRKDQKKSKGNDDDVKEDGEKEDTK